MNWTAPKNTALIIVDVQNDFCPGGKLAVAEGDQIVPAVNEMKQHFDVCVITQDWHPADHTSFANNHEGKEPFTVVEMPYGPQVLWPEHCVQDSEGAVLRDDLNVSTSDLLLQKGTNPLIDSYSGFFENDGKTKPLFADGSTLKEKLETENVNRIVLCGLAYDFCVGWHALDARKEGFEVIVVKDASRSIGIPVGEAGTTETIMDEKLKAAGVHVIHSTQLSQVLGVDAPKPRGLSGGPG